MPDKSIKKRCTAQQQIIKSRMLLFAMLYCKEIAKNGEKHGARSVAAKIVGISDDRATVWIRNPIVVEEIKRIIETQRQKYTRNLDELMAEAAKIAYQSVDESKVSVENKLAAIRILATFHGVTPEGSGGAGSQPSVVIILPSNGKESPAALAAQQVKQIPAEFSIL